MRLLKTARFDRFANSERISDISLIKAIEGVENGLVDANLGAGLIKVRVARQG